LGVIAKGNLHGNGAKLARYLITGRKGERAELVELRGFASSNIRQAFADVHIQAAEVRQNAKPFFHAYVRLPAGEDLTRNQWRHVADRIEKQLGFEGQGRAIAFHHQPNGNTHIHIAWSRTDLEQRRARDPGLYKNKLKEISRQLECELGLMRVSSERPPGRETRAPGRKESEQARRLGTDLAGIREAIRACFDAADNGRSFMAALEAHGLVLARGEQRDFVVVDHAGGLHALSKRIIGVTAAQTRVRLADLDPAALPSVSQARTQLAENLEPDDTRLPVTGGDAVQINSVTLIRSSEMANSIVISAQPPVTPSPIAVAVPVATEAVEARQAPAAPKPPGKASSASTGHQSARAPPIDRHGLAPLFRRLGRALTVRIRQAMTARRRGGNTGGAFRMLARRFSRRFVDMRQDFKARSAITERGIRIDPRAYEGAFLFLSDTYYQLNQMNNDAGSDSDFSEGFDNSENGISLNL
jgi:hypothetical protein